MKRPTIRKTNSALGAIRAAAGYTQAEAASRVGVGRVRLARYESGESRPRRAVLVKMARLYRTSIANLERAWVIQSDAYGA